jgi:hypothetical protein
MMRHRAHTVRHPYSAAIPDTSCPARRQDRLDDVVVARAAADIALEYSRTSCLVGVGFSRNSAVADMIIPGVQKPHCSP